MAPPATTSKRVPLPRTTDLPLARARAAHPIAVTERAAVTYGEKMAEELTGTDAGSGGAFGDGAYGQVSQASTRTPHVNPRPLHLHLAPSPPNVRPNPGPDPRP